MDLNTSGVNFSNFDRIRKLTLPEKMNKLLAEDIGIMIGDGYIGKNTRKTNKSVNYHVECSCDAIRDKKYVLDYIKKLKYALYNLDFRHSIKGKNKSEIQLRRYSRGLVEFYTKVIGLPLGKKTEIGIPNIIFKDKSFIKACLRGIVDTDFSFCLKRNNYPTLKLGTASKRLVLDCERAFKILGLKTKTQFDVYIYQNKVKKYYLKHYIHLYGRENFEKYVKEIGFSNPKNILKLEEYGPGRI